MIDIETAARSLMAQLTAPRGAISVMAWYGEALPEIRVWYDPHYAHLVTEVPDCFDGYPVRTAIRPTFIAH